MGFIRGKKSTAKKTTAKSLFLGGYFSSEMKKNAVVLQ